MDYDPSSAEVNYDLNEEELRELDAIKLSDDLSDSTERQVVNETKGHVTIKKVETGPPRPVNRDAMGRYVPPPGEKPLTEFDVQSPGPADYTYDKTKFLKKFPCYTFSEKHYQKPVKGNPAPNRYNIKGDLQWDKSKGITFKQKAATKDKTLGPGPAPKLYGKEPQCMGGPKFTLRLRAKSLALPGLTNKYFDSCYADNKTPGPCYKPPEDLWLQKPVTMGTFIRRTSKTAGPGPNLGTKKFDGGPKYSFGLKQKKLKRPKQPGPNKYLPNESSKFPKGPKYTMAKVRMPDKLRGDIPGPDLYNRAGFQLDEPGFTMKYRWFESEVQRTPGPPDYNTNKEVIIKTAPSFSIGNTHRKSEKDITPGPSDYIHQPKRCNKGISFGLRHKHKDIEITPGPGAYDNSTCDNAPKWTMAKRYTDKIEKCWPSPGQYKPKLQEDRPGKTLGLKLSTKSVSLGPGPAISQGAPNKSSKCCTTDAFTVKGRFTPHLYSGQKMLPVAPPKDFPHVPLLG